jgi:hypothetical protein
MGALTDLWKSERGLVVIVLILACSVLTGLGQITSDQWLDYTKWLFLIYVGSKTVTGAVQIVKGKPAEDDVVIVEDSPLVKTPDPVQ